MTNSSESMQPTYKVCFKCGISKTLLEFYKHSRMKDGHVNKCKECSKADVLTNRCLKIEYYREYDRERGSRQHISYLKEYRIKYPKKYKATTIVNNAIRSGKLIRCQCVICGDINSHGHHSDYDKPLDLIWFCAAHHSEWHVKNGEGKNPF